MLTHLSEQRGLIKDLVDLGVAPDLLGTRGELEGADRLLQVARGRRDVANHGNAGLAVQARLQNAVDKFRESAESAPQHRAATHTA